MAAIKDNPVDQLGLLGRNESGSSAKVDFNNELSVSENNSYESCSSDSSTSADIDIASVSTGTVSTNHTKSWFFGPPKEVGWLNILI